MSDPAAILPPEQPLLPARPEQRRALYIVLGVVGALAALALLFARGADRLDARWTAQLSDTSTVQVLVPSNALRDTQMAETEAILRESVPGARITPLTLDASLGLLRPWLGDTRLPDDLPVPGIITVESTAAMPVESLQRQFEARGIRASVDDHARFSGRLARTVDRVVLLGAGLVALTLIAAVAVSVFATRAGLAAQRDIIHVLVQAGASDGFIARLFVWQAARNGAVGGALGAALGVILWLYVSFGPGRGTVGWSGAGASVTDMIWLLGLALAFGGVCALAAGWAARRQLSYERRRA